MSRRSQWVLATTVAGAMAASGVAVATRRSVRTQQAQPDPEADTLARPAVVDRERSVRTEDGLALHVEEVGRPDAELTVVFVHGWTCTQEAWIYQRQALASDRVRLVFYDQRGHGRSDRPEPENTGIDILGGDLLRVIAAAEAPGKVVLVGHSMGGMTIMALADQHPELFAPSGPVAGVGLLSTSSGRLGSVTLGLPVLGAKAAQLVLPRTYRVLERFGDRIEGRRGNSDIGWLLAKRVSYAGEVPPSYVELMEHMMSQTPLATFAGFGNAVLGHSKLEALAALTATPTLILVGGRDLLTPADHSETMARALPDAELVVLPDCGHMVMLECHALVCEHLRTLFDRAAALPARVA